MREYKNKIISVSYKLEESEIKNKKLLEEIDLKETKLLEIETAKKELESKIELNKGLIELLSNLEENKEEESDIIKTIEAFMKKQDGMRCLTNFIFLLNQKIKNYQEEIQKRKIIYHRFIS